ncbi:MAG: phosphatidylglycerophosphatase A [Pseudomonadota bacterium]
MARLIATFFYVGYLRPAPGTWGSLAGALLAWPIIAYGGPTALMLGAAVAFALGVWATKREAGPDDHDPSRIVIDEVAGQWVTLVPLAVMIPAASPTVFGALLALGFGLFRLFDIWKPWPVSWADRRDDALGVMLDDILAGVLAALAWIAIVVAAGLAVFGSAL